MNPIKNPKHNCNKKKVKFLGEFIWTLNVKKECPTKPIIAVKKKAIE